LLARELEPLWAAPNLRITDLRVNGARIDVRVRSDSGAEWLAVLWVAGEPPAGLTLVDVTVYARPLEFRASGPGMVVVLNGPSSVGKSSTMAALADAASTPWACFDEPMVGRLPTKFLAFLDAAGPVAAGFLAALSGAARVGNQLVASAGGIE